MSRLNISGGVVPLNLSVFYTFPFAVLENALGHFYGDISFELEVGEEPGAAIKPTKKYVFDGGEEEFEHLCVLMSYQHEQFHLRHLTASPIGLLLYVLGGRQYTYLDANLKKWGERRGKHPDKPRIPALEHHADDEEIRRISETRETFGVFYALFTGDVLNLTLGEALEGVIPALFTELEAIFTKTLGRSESYPGIRLMGEPERPVSINRLTGEAVIEGLARANELHSVILLGAPMQVLNRYIALKMHGAYAISTAMVEKLLNVKAPHSWRVVAKFSDWALQAPVVPFLLNGRSHVCLEELLPCWRLFMVISRFDQSRFSLNDLDRNEREVAEEIFSGLGWESPYRIAERIRKADLIPPSSVLSRHYVENLQLGARLREEAPHVLSLPMLGDAGHRLQAIYNVFQDRLVPGTTGKVASDPRTLSLNAVLLHNAVVDAVMVNSDLSRPFWFAELLVKSYVDGTRVSASDLVEKYLVGVVGRATASCILGQAEVVKWMSAHARELFQRGDIKEAGALEERVLNARLKTLGEEHPETLTAMNNRAVSLYATGDRARSLALHEKVLETRRRVLGNEHPDTLTSINNVGLVLSEQGELVRACELQEEALRTLERLHGDDDPKTLAARNNLASTLARQGDLEGARTLHQKTFEAYKRVLGDEHPYTINSMSNLAMAHYRLGDHGEARRLQETALEARRRILGEDHPDTLNVMNNLAQTLAALTDYEEARKLHETALAARRRVLGEAHPDTLISMGNLGLALEHLGRLEKAQELKRRSLALHRRLLGEEHPNTLAVMDNLASTHVAREEFADACTLYRTAYEIRCRTLGREHPDTTVSALGLYATLLRLGDVGAAQAVLDNGLAWLLERDPSTLGATRQAVRDVVERAVGRQQGLSSG